MERGEKGAHFRTDKNAKIRAPRANSGEDVKGMQKIGSDESL